MCDDVAMLLRKGAVAASITCLALIVSGCSSSDENDTATAGADALCSDFSWEGKEGLTGNEERMSEIVADATGEDGGLGTALTAAEKQCPEVFTEYLAAVEEDQNTDNEVEPPVAADLEDPALTERLDARGVDRTEVLLLGSVMEATRVEKPGEEGLPYGVAQRRTVEAIEQCEAVAAGEKSYADLTQFYVEQGAKEGQAKQVATYLESVFCELIR